MTTSTPQERAARGKAARKKVPRSSHAAWQAPSGRADPVALLEEQAANRVPELVPIRYGRMLTSPFAFYRGAACVMVADLAATPQSGIRAQVCGDAHLVNFGGFAAPDREMVFDINDFDETIPGPWEFDLKRLGASIEIAGRDRGFSRQERRNAVVSALREYREAMARFAGQRDLDVWYARLDLDAFLPELRRQLDARRVKDLQETLDKARGKNSLRAFEKLTVCAEGEPRIESDPPLVVPVRELLPSIEAQELDRVIRGGIREYGRTLQGDRRRLLEGFRYTDLARKVVGVGSVGTRSWIVLMLGRDEQDPLFLQVKQAQASVLEPFVGKSAFSHHGRRVVEGQRLMQAASDILLGWTRVQGVDGVVRDFYVRQLWDSKASPRVETMLPDALAIYGRMCGWTLARAHARSGDRIAIASYLGSGGVFDEAVADFAVAYADQNERDFAVLAEAAKTGKIEVQTGI